MSFVCEISGESLSTAADEVVVTPSGHVCLKRLLLSKLSENGGMDPWVEGRPLSEDQLITLSGNNSKTLPPRPQQATSMPSLLTLLSKEYDALVLELFDTRKALEDTRRELSQALYQNDAAIRVVARLAQERDAAQAQLEQWNGSVGAAASAPTTAAAQDTNGDEEEPPTKRQKLSDGPLKGDIPEADLKIMTDTWETLHKERKPTLKAAAAEAPTPEVLATFEETDHKAWHKSTCKAVTCMSQCEEASLLVTGAKDKHVCLYNTESQVVAHDINFGTIPAAVAVNASYFAAGDGKGKLVIYKVDDGSVAVEFKGDSAVVDLSFHPSGKFLVAASAAGRVSIYSLDGEDIAEMSYFEAEEDIEYESGALHPDGLIYAAGTKSGAVHIWDFKNKTLASTMKEGDDGDAIAAIEFSNNGYHIAVAHHSGVVRALDLRKQKAIATLNESGELKAVTSVAYDPSGKYLAYGGTGSIAITTVKEWGSTATIAVHKSASSLVWGGKSGLIACSDKERQVRFFGAK